MNNMFSRVVCVLLLVGLVTGSAFAQEEASPEAPAESPQEETVSEAPVENSQEESAPESAPVEEALAAYNGDLKSLSVIAAEVEWQENANKPAPPPPPLETGVGIQATFNAQEAVEAGALESTANPETASTTEAEVVEVAPKEEATSTEEIAIPVVPDEATSTQQEASTSTAPAGGGQAATAVIAGTASLEVLDGDITEGEAVEPESVDIIIALEPEPVAEAIIAEVEAEPEAEFMFALTGKQIPTKKTRTTSEGFSQDDEEVDATLTPIIDNETGVMHIAGQCSDMYYVVLLFKNERDYARDPRSYILNQAFPCENGQFSYSISELPYTLPSGTYYLLVGEQGARGAWTPITSLTEITIDNRN